MKDHPASSMTIREQFAIAALNGLLADPEDHSHERRYNWVDCPHSEADTEKYVIGMGSNGHPKWGNRKKVYTETCAQAVARLAVEHADALIEALNRPKP